MTKQQKQSQKNVCAARVKVLAPLPLARAYDYGVAEGLAVQPGDYVRIPFGKREVVGVVWEEAPDLSVAEAKLKFIIEKFSVPPMPKVQREFIDWVARYTLSDLGSVLRMAISPLDVLSPPKTVQVYTIGNLSGQMNDKRQQVVNVLRDGKPRRTADLARAAQCSPALIKSMVQEGQLKSVAQISDPPCQIDQPRKSEIDFSDEQKIAIEALLGLMQAQSFSTVLLDGVTGAGKTEVYFEAVAQALRDGRQALILLPEIALSAQFVQRFEKRFGVRPALWHSEISAAQKRSVWQGVATGKTKVVAGARSALFLPFADLGVLVVDEEHDASYKQEEGVLYNARDMAVMRARLGEIPCVLASATPSLETMTNAQSGKYHYLQLQQRHSGATLPDIRIIDLKTDKPERGKFIAPPLRQALLQTLEQGEQSILFLNRRGYAPLTLCRSCGHRFQCPNCSAWLVEHRRHPRLQCHHCGTQIPVPKSCPTCAAEDSFAACGPGVERIEEEVKELFPQARSLVLASDVTTSPTAITQAIDEITQGKVDIIIGTQIVAKGHHFPKLTCVGVIDADLGLAGGDLRAGERTFQLLQQVAGRAGRGEKPGHVFLQTYMPQQKVIQALASYSRDAFLAAEAEERERAGMPPFGRLASVIVQGQDETALDQFCRQLARAAPRYEGVRILGPAPALMAFLRGRHRRRFLVVAGRDVHVQKVIETWLEMVRTPANLRLRVDIDPQSFF